MSAGVFVFASCLAMGPAASIGGEKEPEGRILFDYRTRGPGAPALSDLEQDRIVKAVTKAVVWDGLDEKVWINSAVSGSFSKPKARETAYMLQPGGPRAMEPQSMMETVVAVFSGQRLVAAVQTPGWNFIRHVEDVDHDGVDELLLDGSYLTFGVLMTSARLVRLKGRDLGEVHEFGGVYENGCGNESSMEVRAGVLRYAGTGFRVDVYAAPCVKDGGDPKADQYKYRPGDKITW